MDPRFLRTNGMDNIWTQDRGRNRKKVGSMKTDIFWYAASFNLVEIYRRFRGAYYLHHQEKRL
jgi:hypothetical protein